MKKIGIIGGGIVGLCAAYYLRKAGHEVTVVDQSDLSDGCSYGNAGMIVPSHIIPLASPGMIAKGFRWMFNSTSPFYVRPRLNRDLLKWGYRFYKSSTEENVRRAIPALRDISMLSKSMYQQLSKDLPFDFGYQERGLLGLYQTAATEHEEAETARIANQHGVEAHILLPGEIQRMEPDVQIKARGGIYFPGDAQVIPQTLMRELLPLLETMGVQLRRNVTLTGFVTEDGKVKAVRTSAGEMCWDEIVVAGGSWSGEIARLFELELPMQAGKGYSFTIDNVKRNSRIPTLFLEARVAVTPMGSSLRFGGTMEITGVDYSVSMNRVRGIVNAIPSYYPDMQVAMPKKKEVWHGLRPCSPDGLPYIGRLKKWKNVVLATGHSMMGLSLGPGTGKLVTEIINEERTSMALTAFDPERYQ